MDEDDNELFAYELGSHAYQNGHTRFDCPSYFCENERDEFQRGWEDAYYQDYPEELGQDRGIYVGLLREDD